MASSLQSESADELVAPESPPSATSGAQENAPEEAVATVIVPLQMAHVTRLVTGVAAAHPRSLGHDFSAQIVAANMQQMEDTIAQLRSDLRALTRRNEQLKDEVGDLQTAKEVLEERLGTKSKVDAFRGVFGVGGSALVAIAIDLFKAQFVASVVVGIIGALLIAFSIIGIPRGAKK